MDGLNREIGEIGESIDCGCIADNICTPKTLIAESIAATIGLVATVGSGALGSFLIHLIDPKKLPNCILKATPMMSVIMTVIQLVPLVILFAAKAASFVFKKRHPKVFIAINTAAYLLAFISYIATFFTTMAILKIDFLTALFAGVLLPAMIPAAISLTIIFPMLIILSIVCVGICCCCCCFVPKDQGEVTNQFLADAINIDRLQRRNQRF